MWMIGLSVDLWCGGLSQGSLYGKWPVYLVLAGDKFGRDHEYWRAGKREEGVVRVVYSKHGGPDSHRRQFDYQTEPYSPPMISRWLAIWTISS